MPHPLREKARGRMVYAVPLIIFMDDVSGNISKQWNKHHVIYMSNGSMPREMLEKEFCVRFVTSSPHASPMELMKAMKDSIGYGRRSVSNGDYLLLCSAKQQTPELMHMIANIGKMCSFVLMGSSGRVTIPCKLRNAATAASNVIISVGRVMLGVTRCSKSRTKASRVSSRSADVVSIHLCRNVLQACRASYTGKDEGPNLRASPSCYSSRWLPES